METSKNSCLITSGSDKPETYFLKNYYKQLNIKNIDEIIDFGYNKNTIEAIYSNYIIKNLTNDYDYEMQKLSNKENIYKYPFGRISSFNKTIKHNISSDFINVLSQYYLDYTRQDIYVYQDEECETIKKINNDNYLKKLNEAYNNISKSYNEPIDTTESYKTIIFFFNYYSNLLYGTDIVNDNHIGLLKKILEKSIIDGEENETVIYMSEVWNDISTIKNNNKRQHIFDHITFQKEQTEKKIENIKIILNDQKINITVDERNTINTNLDNLINELNELIKKLINIEKIIDDILKNILENSYTIEKETEVNSQLAELEKFSNNFVEIITKYLNQDSINNINKIIQNNEKYISETYNINIKAFIDEYNKFFNNYNKTEKQKDSDSLYILSKKFHTESGLKRVQNALDNIIKTIKENGNEYVIDKIYNMLNIICFQAQTMLAYVSNIMLKLLLGDLFQDHSLGVFLSTKITIFDKKNKIISISTMLNIRKERYNKYIDINIGYYIIFFKYNSINTDIGYRKLFNLKIDFFSYDEIVNNINNIKLEKSLDNPFFKLINQIVLNNYDNYKTYFKIEQNIDTIAKILTHLKNLKEQNQFFNNSIFIILNYSDIRQHILNELKKINPSISISEVIIYFKYNYNLKKHNISIQCYNSYEKEIAFTITEEDDIKKIFDNRHLKKLYTHTNFVNTDMCIILYNDTIEKEKQIEYSNKISEKCIEMYYKEQCRIINIKTIICCESKTCSELFNYIKLLYYKIIIDYYTKLSLPESPLSTAVAKSSSSAAAAESPSPAAEAKSPLSAESESITSTESPSPESPSPAESESITSTESPSPESPLPTATAESPSPDAAADVESRTSILDETIKPITKLNIDLINIESINDIIESYNSLYREIKQQKTIKEARPLAKVQVADPLIYAMTSRYGGYKTKKQLNQKYNISKHKIIKKSNIKNKNKNKKTNKKLKLKLKSKKNF